MHRNIRVKEAAQICGVSVSLLNKLRCYGGGPTYMKIGPMVIYNTADLEAWLAAGRRDKAGDNAAEKVAA